MLNLQLFSSGTERKGKNEKIMHDESVTRIAMYIKQVKALPFLLS